MDLAGILFDLKAERARIDAAISALESNSAPRRRGRPPSTIRAAKPGRRRMSAAARKRIGDAKRKWWEARKRKA